MNMIELEKIQFRGRRLGEHTASGVVVEYCTIDEQEWKPLPLCLEWVNHSPTGFNWGYYGSGPSQLAFAILHKYLCYAEGMNAENAANAVQDIYQLFKRTYVAGWQDHWHMSGEQIKEWLDTPFLVG